MGLLGFIRVWGLGDYLMFFKGLCLQTSTPEAYYWTMLSGCCNFYPMHGSRAFFCRSKVWKQKFWMKKWGHNCLKPTILWSSSRAIRSFFAGPLQKGFYTSAVQTCVKYKDKAGKTRYKGSKHLKGTQLPSCNDEQM